MFYVESIEMGEKKYADIKTIAHTFKKLSACDFQAR